jgi:hypothetical protein
MTKKHFIELADAIRDHNRIANNRLKNGDDSLAPFTPEQLGTLAHFCRLQNSGFMRDRWLAYIAGECGKNGGRK